MICQVLKECLASNPKLTAGVGGDNMTCLIVLLNRTAKINEDIDQKNDLNTKENKNNENVSKNNDKEHENGSSCNEKNARKSNYKFQLHSPP
jgi:hypothetical protein